MATKGFPSLTPHTCESRRARLSPAVPARASACTRPVMSDRDRGARASGTVSGCRASSPRIRRASAASASSSSRTLASTSPAHPRTRRLTKASSRRLISSAQCRSSRSSTRGRRAARCSTSWATLSNRRRSLSLGGGSPGVATSGSNRLSSARQAGLSAATASSSGPTSPVRHASTHGPKGRIASLSWPRPISTRQSRSTASVARVASSRVLPTPASPVTIVTCPRPWIASSRSPRSRPSSPSRPKSGVSPAGSSTRARAARRASRARSSPSTAGALVAGAGRRSSSW